MAGVSFISLPASASASKGSDTYLHSEQQQLTTEPDLTHSDQSSSTESSEISELKKHNKRLQEENQSLKVEMQEFEHKLSYLEYALGVIDGDGFSDTSTYMSPQNLGLRVEQKEEKATEAIDNDNDNVVDCTLASIKKASDEKDKIDQLEKNDRPYGASNGIALSNHSEEMKRLLTKNASMLTAIKALAKAALAQKHKHDLYKNKSKMSKKEITNINKQLNTAVLEKQEAHSLYLQEKDKKDEVQNEINRLAANLKALTATYNAEKVNRIHHLQQLEKEIGDSIVIPREDENGDTGSDSVQVELTSKKQIIAQLQLKLDIFMKHTKKQAMENRANDHKLTQCKDKLKTDGFSMLSKKSTESTEMSI